MQILKGRLMKQFPLKGPSRIGGNWKRMLGAHSDEYHKFLCGGGCGTEWKQRASSKADYNHPIQSLNSQNQNRKLFLLNWLWLPFPSPSSLSSHFHLRFFHRESALWSRNVNLLHHPDAHFIRNGKGHCTPVQSLLPKVREISWNGIWLVGGRGGGALRGWSTDRLVNGLSPPLMIPRDKI